MTDNPHVPSGYADRLETLEHPDVEFDDRCTSCKAPILWRRHLRTGNRAPIDAAPVPDGRVILVDAGYYDLLAAGDPRAGEHEGELRTPHFVTCPNGPAHRRRR